MKTQFFEIKQRKSFKSNEKEHYRARNVKFYSQNINFDYDVNELY